MNPDPLRPEATDWQREPMPRHDDTLLLFVFGVAVGVIIGLVVGLAVWWR